MGQKNLKEQINEKFQVYQVLQQNHMILRQKSTQNIFIMKQLICFSSQQYQYKLQRLNKKKQLHNQHFLSLQQIKHIQQHSLCSNSIKVYLLYQYCLHHLSQQINSRIKNYRYFLQKQIWSILFSSVIALVNLQKNNDYHGCIIPEQIYITEDGSIKIGDPDLCPYTKKSYYVPGFYYSPQELLNFQNLSNQQYDRHKSDVFSLGVCLIHAALLQRCSDIYNNKYSILERRLEDRLKRVNSKYSIKLRNVLSVMTKLNEKDRPNFIQLQSLLKDLMNYQKSNAHQSSIKHTFGQQFGQGSNKIIIQNNLKHSNCQNVNLGSLQSTMAIHKKEENKPRDISNLYQKRNSWYELQKPRMVIQQNHKMMYSQSLKKEKQIPFIAGSLNSQFKQNFTQRKSPMSQLQKKNKDFNWYLKNFDKLFVTKQGKDGAVKYLAKQISHLNSSLSSASKSLLKDQDNQPNSDYGIYIRKGNNVTKQPDQNNQQNGDLKLLVAKSKKQQIIQQHSLQSSQHIHKQIKQYLPNSKMPSLSYRKIIPTYSTEQFQGGAKYFGWKLNGMRQGHGNFYYQDGGFYSGMWKENKMFGHGILYYASGLPAYDGEWKNDQFHGVGALFNQTPQDLQEPFNYDNFDEIGNYWLRYEGDFLEDNKQGYGRLFLTNGEMFEGIFLNDQINGKGEYYTLKKTYTKGIWMKNKLIRQFN